MNPPPIIFQDHDLLVIDKPPGLLSSTGPRDARVTAIGLLREHVLVRRGEKIGLVHRLDKDASGLMVFSKNDDAYEHLKRQFADHTAERIYAALVSGALDPPAGTIESDLIELADGSVRDTGRKGAGDHAITHYTTLRIAGDISLLRVKLETGRKHQIRTHLASRGCPIVNDRVYTRSSLEPLRTRQRVRPEFRPKSRGLELPPLMLAAIELCVTHPRTQERLEWVLPLPEPMRQRLRGS